MNYLEIGKILRPHGIKGAVKVEKYLDADFSRFANVFVGLERQQAKLISHQKLNNDACIMSLDIITSPEQAEKFRNKPLYIDRDTYQEYSEKLYLSDLLNKPVLDENDNQLGMMIDYDDYGATIILTIKCGVVSYQLPFAKDVIDYDKQKQAFVTTKQKFEDLRI